MNQKKVDPADERVALLIFDSQGWRWNHCIAEDIAITLVAAASEDPADWQTLSAYWPRYRTPVVPDTVRNLSLTPADAATIQNSLPGDGRWIAIDLVHQRVSTGDGIDPVGRDQVFSMQVDVHGKHGWPLSVHLPPWWELEEATGAETLGRKRSSSVDRPYVDRDVLYGEPMIEDLARRIADVYQSQRWRECDAVNDPRTRHRFTIEVHRDWLMTPREDLGGRRPRQMLHGGKAWNAAVIGGQQLRLQEGGSLVAAPTDVPRYDETPMGHEEVCVYFDLCRVIIDAGWAWCIGRGVSEPINLCEMRDHLRRVKEEWLDTPSEGGSPPRFVLECSRRRVPRAVGVEIDGIEGCESSDHYVDCDCPICQMAADGMFGIEFSMIDGHHLELDQEFAFSLWENYDDWEADQGQFEQIMEELDQGEESSRNSSDSVEEADDFASVWTQPTSDEPLPGDPNRHLQLAFLLAEIVSTLQLADAPRDEIESLNSNYRSFRLAEEETRDIWAERLKACLDTVASNHQELVSRVADFQSRVDETVRAGRHHSGDSTGRG